MVAWMSDAYGDTAAGLSSEQILEELRRHRQALHRIPELDFDLPRTIEYVRHHLDGLCCEVFEPCRSCVCAYFDAGRDSTVAVRARYGRPSHRGAVLCAGAIGNAGAYARVRP